MRITSESAQLPVAFVVPRPCLTTSYVPLHVYHPKRVIHIRTFGKRKTNSLCASHIFIFRHNIIIYLLCIKI